jgi:hypothetical protein
MHQELKEQFNFDHVDKLPFNEVKEAYDIMEFAREYKHPEKNDPFLVYCSSKIDLLHQWSTIADVELQLVLLFCPSKRWSQSTFLEYWNYLDPWSPMRRRNSWDGYQNFATQCLQWLFALGGGFTQLMVWQGVADLWTGRIMDTDYTKHVGYLKRKHKFQERDKVVIDGKEIVKPFVNVHDKAFWVNTAAWSEG